MRWTGSAQLGLRDGCHEKADRGNMVDSNSIQERFAWVMTRTPDAIAVSSPVEAVTYAELDERANRIARRLTGLGVRPEDPVMVLQERSVEMVASILGIVKAGALYLPLHSAYPLPRLQWIADNVGRPVLLADASMRGRGLPEVPATVFVDSDRERRSESTKTVAGTSGSPRPRMIASA